MKKQGGCPGNLKLCASLQIASCNFPKRVYTTSRVIDTNEGANVAKQHNVQIYFDSEEQKKALGHRAVDEGVSMSELAKRVLVQALDLPRTETAPRSNSEQAA